jgi:hypothetical protein
MTPDLFNNNIYPVDDVGNFSSTYYQAKIKDAFYSIGKLIQEKRLEVFFCKEKIGYDYETN